LGQASEVGGAQEMSSVSGDLMELSKEEFFRDTD
jgi:hypothetical protein